MIQFIKDIVNNIKSKLDSRGQGMVEYAVVLAAVVAIAVAVLYTGGNNNTTAEGGTNGQGSLESAVSGAFSKATNNINNAGSK